MARKVLDSHKHNLISYCPSDGCLEGQNAMLNSDGGDLIHEVSEAIGNWAGDQLYYVLRNNLVVFILPVLQEL